MEDVALAQFGLSQVPIQWEEVSVTPILKGGKTVIPDNAIQSVKRNTVALKGKNTHKDFVLNANILPSFRSPCHTQYVAKSSPYDSY